MTRYMMIFLFVGLLCMTLYGPAAAEAPVSALTDDGYSVSGPVETGSVPEAGLGSSEEGRDDASRGPTVEYGGKSYFYNNDTP